MDRQVPFGRIVAHVMPHFISRQVYTGAGKVGTEVAGLTSEDVPFQLTQRADFFEEEVGLETTLKRPIVNTRDEPTPTPSATGACTSSSATPTSPRWPRSSRWAPPPWCCP